MKIKGNRGVINCKYFNDKEGWKYSKYHKLGECTATCKNDNVEVCERFHNGWYKVMVVSLYTRKVCLLSKYDQYIMLCTVLSNLIKIFLFCSF